jgi:hypothetical protein
MDMGNVMLFVVELIHSDDDTVKHG